MNNPTILSLTCGTHKRGSHLSTKERQGKTVIAMSEDPCPRRGRRAMGWSGVVGIACGCGSGRNKKRDGRRGSTSIDKLSCLLTHALHTAHCKEQ